MLRGEGKVQKGRGERGGWGGEVMGGRKGINREGRTPPPTQIPGSAPVQMSAIAQSI